MRSATYMYGFLLIAGALACPGVALAAGRAEITGVKTRSIQSSMSMEKPVQNLQGRHLTKFFDSIPVWDEQVEVAWTAPERGVGEDAQIAFEYKLTDARGIQVRTTPVSAAGGENKTTTFILQGAGGSAGSKLSAWRARLLSRGMALAEKKTTTWK